MVSSILHILLTGLLLLLFLLAGQSISLRIKAFSGLSLLEQLLVATGLGMGILAIWVFLAGLMQQLNLYFIGLPFLALAFMYPSGKIKFIRSIPIRNYLKTFRGAELPYQLLAITLGAFVLLNLFRSLAPVTDHDSLEAYLFIPKIYIENQGIGPISFTKWDDLPLNAEMLTLFTMLLQDDILAKVLLGWSTGLLSVLVIYSAGKILVNRKAGIIAALLFYTIPEVIWLTNTVKVDLSWAFWEFLAFLLFLHWLKKKEDLLIIVAFAFLGLALGTKYLSLPSIFFYNLLVLLIYIFGKKQPDFKKLLKALLFANLTALLLALPYLLKNWVYVNNPVFPYFFAGSADANETRSYSGLSGILDFYWNSFFLKDFFAEKMFYTGSLAFGGLIIGLVPALMFYRGRNRSIMALMIPVWFAYTLILMSSAAPQPRHLLNSIPLMILPASAGLVALLQQRWFIRLPFLLVFLFPLALSFKVEAKEFLIRDLSYVLGRETKNEYLEKNLFSLPKHLNPGMMKFVNQQLQKDDLILTLYYCHAYYVDIAMTIDYNLEKRFVHKEEDQEQILSNLRSLGITYIYLSDSDFSTRELKWQKMFAKTALLSESFRDKYLTHVHTSGDQHLYRIEYR